MPSNQDLGNTIAINKAGDAHVIQHKRLNKWFIRCVYYPGKGKIGDRRESEYFDSEDAALDV